MTPLSSANGVALHWEHGYRCHGLWTKSNRRVGVVGIGPRGTWTKADGYTWQVDSPREEGTAPSLRKAKAEVEQRARALSCLP